jgi:hypothetical protein
MRTHIAFYSITRLLATALSGTVLLASPFPSDAGATSQSGTDLVADADALAARSDQMCGQLIGVLKDTLQDRDVRARAADLLARLRYRPAIPVLIEHVDLYAPRFLAGSAQRGQPEAINPCARALAAFGEMAIYETIGAARADDSPGKRNVYDYVIRDIARNSEVARVYLGQVIAEEPDSALKERLGECLRWAIAAAAAHGAATQPGSTSPAVAPATASPERLLADARVASARKDHASASRLAVAVLKHSLATEQQKRQAQIILKRVAVDRAAESRVTAPASQPAAPPASQPGTPPASAPSPPPP